MKTQRLIALSVIAAVSQLGELPHGSWFGGAAPASRLMAAEFDARRPGPGGPPSTPPGPSVPAPQPQQQPMEAEPIDGVGNNLANPLWGSAGSDLLRLTAAAYADGVDSPSLPNDLTPAPSAIFSTIRPIRRFRQKILRRWMRTALRILVTRLGSFSIMTWT